MKQFPGLQCGRRGVMLLAAVALAFTTYVEQVSSLPAEAINQWPSFPRRNIAALARAGYLKSSANAAFKRSISTLAKNGQLPTFRSPYLQGDSQDRDEEDSSQEKRNLGSIARLRSYSAMKRNIQALARDGYRGGRGRLSAPDDKRNIAAMARNGLLIHKRDDDTELEYYYPFYQNPIPPLLDMDGPLDSNELYDYQQSVNPDMFPPLSQVYKRSAHYEEYPEELMHGDERSYDSNWFFKRGAAGMPVHGLYRPHYGDPSSRSKRYILAMPDTIDTNDVDKLVDDNDKRSVDEEVLDNFQKRHIGSLARKYSNDQNFGIRQYIADGAAVGAVGADDADLPPAAVLAHSHPTGRFLRRPLNNDIPALVPDYPPAWQRNKNPPKYYYFRSLKVPYESPRARSRLAAAAAAAAAASTAGLRARNGSLPARIKNQ